MCTFVVYQENKHGCLGGSKWCKYMMKMVAAQSPGIALAMGLQCKRNGVRLH